MIQEVLQYISTNWLYLLGALIGLVYVYFEYKADMKVWITGLIMSCVCIYGFVHEKVYALACIYLYYIVLGIWGWVTWKKEENSGENLSIRHTPKSYILPLSAIALPIFLLLYYILSKYTDTQAPYSDSLGSTLNVIAMWMLTKKIVEQWLLLLVSNILYTITFYNQCNFPYASLYFVFFIASIVGYIRWRRMAKKYQTTNL